MIKRYYVYILFACSMASLQSVNRKSFFVALSLLWSAPFVRNVYNHMHYDDLTNVLSSENRELANQLNKSDNPSALNLLKSYCKTALYDINQHIECIKSPFHKLVIGFLPLGVCLLQLYMV